MNKHQQTSLSDITMTKGGRIAKLLMLDWWETLKGLLGMNRTTPIVSTEHPTKEDWNLGGAIIQQTTHTNLQATLFTRQLATSLVAHVEALV